MLLHYVAALALSACPLPAQQSPAQGLAFAPGASGLREVVALTPLRLEQAGAEHVYLQIPIEGRSQSFTLERLQVRGEGYQLLLDHGGEQLDSLPEGAGKVYWGVSVDGRYRALFGWDGSFATGSIRDRVTGDEFEYRTEDTSAIPARTWRTTGQAPSISSAPSDADAAFSGVNAPPLGRIEVVADLDYEFFALFNEDPNAAELQALTVFGLMAVEHWHDPLETDDPRIELRVPYTVIRTVPGAPYDATSLSGNLNNMEAEWNGPLGFLDWSAVQLFSGKDHSDSGNVGVTFIFGLCLEKSVGIYEFTHSGLNEAAWRHTWLLATCAGVPECTSSVPGCDLMCNGDVCGSDQTGFAPSSLASLESQLNADECINKLPNVAATSAPAISGLSASTVPAVSAETASSTMTGSGFLGVDSVSIGGFELDYLKGEFSVESNSRIQLEIPELPALGTQSVVVSNALGSSSTTLQIAANSTPTLDLVDSLPRVLDSDGSAQIFVGSQPGDIVLLYASSSQVPSSLPGIVELSIGDNFTLLADLGIYFVDASTGYVDYSAPLALVETGVELYVQAVVLSPDLALPAKVTNVEVGYVL